MYEIDFSKTVYYLDPRSTSIADAKPADIQALTLAELVKSWAATVMTGQGEQPEFFVDGRNIRRWRSGASKSEPLQGERTAEAAERVVLEWAHQDFFNSDTSGCYFPTRDEAENDLAEAQRELNAV